MTLKSINPKQFKSLSSSLMKSIKGGKKQTALSTYDFQSSYSSYSNEDPDDKKSKGSGNPPPMEESTMYTFKISI